MVLGFTPFRSAFAGPRALKALRWLAPQGCPTGDDVQSRLEAIVGRELADAADAQIAVARGATGTFVAQLSIREGAGDVGSRVLEEATCTLVADAAATVIALSLRARTTATDPPAAERATQAPEIKPAGSEDRSARAPLARPASKFAAGIRVMVDHGTLPSTAIGAGLGVSWQALSTLSIEASVVRALDQSVAVEGQPYGGTFQLTFVDVGSCWSALGRAVTLGPCAGVGVAHIDAHGFGSTAVKDGAATWWYPTVGASVRWHPHRALTFGAMGDAASPIERRAFVILDGGFIHKPAFASGRGQLFGEVRF